MKVRSSRKSFVSLESVAMTDIVMNLFIFFFISFSLLTTFNPSRERESKIEVKLPKAESKEKGPEDDKTIVVSVTSGNEIYVGKSLVLPDRLKDILSQRLQTSKVSAVIVRSDKLASVETLVRVLDTAKQLGVQKLGVAIDLVKVD